MSEVISDDQSITIIITIKIMQSNIPPPKAGRSYNDKSYVVCSDKRGAIFVIGRRYTPERVLTFTTLANP